MQHHKRNLNILLALFITQHIAIVFHRPQTVRLIYRINECG